MSISPTLAEGRVPSRTTSKKLPNGTPFSLRVLGRVGATSVRRETLRQQLLKTSHMTHSLIVNNIHGFICSMRFLVSWRVRRESGCVHVEKFTDLQIRSVSEDHVVVPAYDTHYRYSQRHFHGQCRRRHRGSPWTEGNTPALQCTPHAGGSAPRRCFGVSLANKSGHTRDAAFQVDVHVKIHFHCVALLWFANASLVDEVSPLPANRGGNCCSNSRCQRW